MEGNGGAKSRGKPRLESVKVASNQTSEVSPPRSRVFALMSFSHRTLSPLFPAPFILRAPLAIDRLTTPSSPRETRPRIFHGSVSFRFAIDPRGPCAGTVAQFSKHFNTHHEAFHRALVFWRCPENPSRSSSPEERSELRVLALPCTSPSIPALSVPTLSRNTFSITFSVVRASRSSVQFFFS